jgi:ABC-2 type transport system permease protein
MVTPQDSASAGLVSRTRPYRAIINARFRTLLQYRAAALAGFGTQLVFGLIRIMVLGAFYAVSTTPQPMTYQDVVAYVWLGQALLAMLPWNMDRDVAQMIRTGNVAYELLRPVDLYGYWYARVLTMRVAPTLLRALPMFLVAGLFFGLQAPPSTAAAAAWAAAMFGALLLGCAITTLVTLSMLWTIAGEGVFWMMMTAVMIFSGMVIPLPLFPDWTQAVLRFMPFSGLCDTPFRLYSGNMAPGEVWPTLAHQLAWTAVLVVLGRTLLARGLRRVVVQGG